MSNLLHFSGRTVGALVDRVIPTIYTRLVLVGAYYCTVRTRTCPEYRRKGLIGQTTDGLDLSAPSYKPSLSCQPFPRHVADDRREEDNGMGEIYVNNSLAPPQNTDSRKDHNSEN